MVNLPDVVPSIVYKATNATGSIFVTKGHNIENVTGKSLYPEQTQNKRLGRAEFNMPLLYSAAKKLAAAQFKALKDGRTIILYEAYRPVETQHLVAEEMRKIVGETPYDSSNPNYIEEVAKEIDKWGLTWFISTKDVGNHQMGYAVDVSMGTITGTETIKVDDYEIKKPTAYDELDMPTNMHELSPDSAIYTKPNGSKRSEYTGSDAPTMHGYFSGFGELASEWWHFNDTSARDTAIPREEKDGAGSFELNSNVSAPPSQATSSVTTPSPDPSGPGGGGGGGTTTGGSSTFNDMHALIDNNGGKRIYL